MYYLFHMLIKRPYWRIVLQLYNIKMFFVDLHIAIKFKRKPLSEDKKNELKQLLDELDKKSLGSNA